MSDPYLGIVIDFYIFGRYVSISTPNWNREKHRPSWYPKWEFTSLGIPLSFLPCSSSKVFMLDWFFHLTVMYGPPIHATEEEFDPEGGD